MPRPVIVAGETVHGVWCPACSAPVRIRVPLSLSDAGPVVAHLEVCVSCGHAYMPSAPVVTLVPQSRPRLRRPRPLTALLWRIARRIAARDGHPAAGCALAACRRPGWWTCCWFQAGDDGTTRWVFCGARHRRKWLARP